MKRLLNVLMLLVSVIVVSVTACAEDTIHNLWDLDIVNMDAYEVHDYLESEKGIVSVVRPYTISGKTYHSLRSDDEQGLTILGYPLTLWFNEYWKHSLSLDFRFVGYQEDAFVILNSMIEKYGEPTCIYYDLYNRSESEWEHNIALPMYHKGAFLDSLEDVNLQDMILSWEHYEENEYNWGQFELTVLIDNIRFEITCLRDGRCQVYVTFYGYVPKVDFEPVDESRNISNYVDTGF